MRPVSAGYGRAGPAPRYPPLQPPRQTSVAADESALPPRHASDQSSSTTADDNAYKQKVADFWAYMGNAIWIKSRSPQGNCLQGQSELLSHVKEEPNDSESDSSQESLDEDELIWFADHASSSEAFASHDHEDAQLPHLASGQNSPLSQAGTGKKLTPYVPEHAHRVAARRAAVLQGVILV